ncbi:MAG TPA: hypothetical protein PLF63_14870 [Rubrivivax sp.]|jgi:hypothetical protein|nr:hypothetical protein [Rubrivivax sp.]
MQATRTPSTPAASPVKTPVQPGRPTLLDAAQLKLVSGGGPKGTWIEQGLNQRNGSSF